MRNNSTQLVTAVFSALLFRGDNGTYLCRKGSGVALLGRPWVPLYGLPGTFTSKSGGAGEAPARHQPAAAHLSDAVGEEDPAERGVYAVRVSRSGDSGLELEFCWEKMYKKAVIKKQGAFTMRKNN